MNSYLNNYNLMYRQNEKWLVTLKRQLMESIVQYIVIES